MICETKQHMSQLPTSTSDSSFPPQDPSWASHLWRLYQDLDKVQGYYEGHLDFEERESPFATDTTWATSAFLNECLSFSLKGFPVHIIDPRFTSVHDKNIFSAENQASQLLAEEILQIKWKEYQTMTKTQVDREEFVKINPDLIHPIIFIINTQSAAVDHPADAQAVGGLHWLCLIVLPKKFKGLLQTVGIIPFDQRELSEEEVESPRVFLIDSLRSSSPIPSSLISALTTCCEIQHEVEEKKEDGHIINKTFSIKLPAVLPETTIFQKCSQCNQQRNSFDCGYWSLYNSLMVLLEGSSKFYWQVYADEYALNFKLDQELYNPGFYLRQLFQTIFLEGSQYFSNPMETSKQDLLSATNNRPPPPPETNQGQPSSSSLTLRTIEAISNKKKRKASEVVDSGCDWSPKRHPEPPIITKQNLQDFKLVKFVNGGLPLQQEPLNSPASRIEALEKQIRSLEMSLQELKANRTFDVVDQNDTIIPKPQLKRVKLSQQMNSQNHNEMIPKSVTFASPSEQPRSILIPISLRKHSPMSLTNTELSSAPPPLSFSSNHRIGTFSVNAEMMPSDHVLRTDSGEKMIPPSSACGDKMFFSSDYANTTQVPNSLSHIAKNRTKQEKNRLRRQRRKHNKRKKKEQDLKSTFSYHNPPQSRKYEVIYVPKNEDSRMQIETLNKISQQQNVKQTPRRKQSFHQNSNERNSKSFSSKPNGRRSQSKSFQQQQQSDSYRKRDHSQDRKRSNSSNSKKRNKSASYGRWVSDSFSKFSH